ncbi:tRNA pseudouridine(38-40) synthase TruA [Parafrigoribacterium mesophilum]|uniref:tRNA pseudouridine(38-40) synthase TruA n=1 Tax=Parafrigoribacterium mesophilum TaxID=433646 RepID=UPI0031FC1C06
MDLPTTRIRLDIAYDGGAFNGWARQPALRTVQGELEQRLATIFHRHPPAPTLTVAGRTDAGVHALGQVAHLDLTEEQLSSLTRRGPSATAGATALATRLNGIAGLHSDVVITASAIAPPGFDARFSALSRSYRYRVAAAAAPRNPLERGFTLWYPRTLDGELMDTAARSLTGLHDWAAYCKARDGATTIRTLQQFSWARQGDGVLVADVTADAFCHGMVRALVGACLAVGEGKLDGRDLVALRTEATRTSAFKVAPARGLTLTEVRYPDAAQLHIRALQTRARREPIGSAE